MGVFLNFLNGFEVYCERIKSNFSFKRVTPATSSVVSLFSLLYIHQICIYIRQATPTEPKLDPVHLLRHRYSTEMRKLHDQRASTGDPKLHSFRCLREIACRIASPRRPPSLRFRLRTAAPTHTSRNVAVCPTPTLHSIKLIIAVDCGPGNKVAKLFLQ